MGQGHVGAGQGSASELILYTDYPRIALHLAGPSGVQSERNIISIEDQTKHPSHPEGDPVRRWSARRPLTARDWFEFSRSLVRQLLGCASALSRSVAEGLSKASRTLVEALSKDCRTSLEQQSNTRRRNIEESCVCTHAKAPARGGLGLALGLVFLQAVMCLQARTQQEPFTVAGKVISAAEGAIIEGATVTNKRTGIHSVTDRLGEYSVSARPDDILVYSFVGYVTTEKEINGRAQIIVELDAAENTLEEVEINAGYYTVKDRERTGNISRITAEEIEKQPIRNPLEAMIVRMPGVYIEQNTGLAGGGFHIEIRGRNSISSGNRPLYIVDGVPFPTENIRARGVH